KKTFGMQAKRDLYVNQGLTIDIARLSGVRYPRLPRQAKVKSLSPIWRKEERAGHIYRVAAEIMCQKGFEATSMNDIADVVGLTKAGIYHYIRGKEDLLFQIMGFGMDMVYEDVIA